MHGILDMDIDFIVSCHASCRTSPARRFDDFFISFAGFGLWESPPSISLRVTRKPRFTGRRQRLEGKGLVVAREGISTPSTPYLR
jgi:hypothetical protein